MDTIERKQRRSEGNEKEMTSGQKDDRLIYRPGRRILPQWR